MTCVHAANGCNSPEGECAGYCMPRKGFALTLEQRFRGKIVAEVWPLGDQIEIVFNDGSSLVISPPLAFKAAPEANKRRVCNGR